MMHARPERALCLLVVLIGLGSICANTTSTEAATHIVNVSGTIAAPPFVFTPATLTIQSGDVVRWVWVSGGHTTTSGTGGVPNGIWSAPIDVGNSSFQRTFNSAGSFPYFCVFHWAGGMVGTITVQGGGVNQPPNVVNPGTQTGTEEAFFSVTVFATDPDGDALTMSDLGTTPAWASFNDNGNNSATISGIPALGDAGTTSQSVRAADASVTDTESFDIVIASAPIVQVDLDGTFVPDSVSIPVGWSVRWVKQEGGNHTTTSGSGGVPDGIWDAPLTAQSSTFERLFNNGGTFPYYCANHPTAEVGVVVVNDTTHVGIGEIPGPTYRLFLAPYPNPFSSTTVLAFELEREADVRIDIFDLGGRAVRNFLIGRYPAGRHELRWGGRDDLGRQLANGVYFARLEVDGRREVRKIFKAN